MCSYQLCVSKVYKYSDIKNGYIIYIWNQMLSMPIADNENQSVEKGKKMILRNIPKDVYKIILVEQGKKKVDCECQFSIEQTIYMLIRWAAKEK